MRTAKATEAKMRSVDERMADRLRARGWVVARRVAADHPYQEYNELGNTCQAPGCELTWEEHDV